MKNNLFFTSIVFMHVFSATLNGMDITTTHYMDETIDPFYRIQLGTMFSFAEKNDWGKVNQILQSYTGPLDMTNDKGYTLMHVAVLGNQKKSVATLILKKAPLAQSNMSSKPIITTPLHYAAYKGYTKIGQMLIDSDKTLVNSTHAEFNNTPLHLAAWADHSEFAEMLIMADAKISIYNTFGSSPIHSAAWKNSIQCLKILLAYGGNAEESNSTGMGNTPLYLAAKTGSNDCLKLLIKHMQTKLNTQAFINHLNQECALENITAIQIAGVRENIQCYWDLARAGANYYTKIKCGSKSYLSDDIIGNEPVKAFIKSIEEVGTNYPPYYKGTNSLCFACNVAYKNNDVIVDLTSCNHSFHGSCFQNHAVEKFISKNQDTPGMLFYLKDKSPEEIKHEILTSPIIKIDWQDVEQCPHCSRTISFENVGKIAVFFKG